MTTGTETIEGVTRAFVLSREFDSSRELIYDAWTNPARLARWWGPKGFSVRVVSLDLRPGGTFLYAMRTPDGHEMWGKFVYRDVRPQLQLAFIVSFSDPSANVVRHPLAPNWPLELLSIVTFVERGGRTTLNLRAVPVNATASEREAFEAGHDSLKKGWTGTLDQLEGYLTEAQS